MSRRAGRTRRRPRTRRAGVRCSMPHARRLRRPPPRRRRRAPWCRPPPRRCPVAPIPTKTRKAEESDPGEHSEPPEERFAPVQRVELRRTATRRRTGGLGYFRRRAYASGSSGSGFSTPPTFVAVRSSSSGGVARSRGRENLTYRVRLVASAASTSEQHQPRDDGENHREPLVRIGHVPLLRRQRVVGLPPDGLGRRLVRRAYPARMPRPARAGSRAPSTRTGTGSSRPPPPVPARPRESMLARRPNHARHRWTMTRTTATPTNQPLGGRGSSGRSPKSTWLASSAAPPRTRRTELSRRRQGLRFLHPSPASARKSASTTSAIGAAKRPRTPGPSTRSEVAGREREDRPRGVCGDREHEAGHGGPALPSRADLRRSFTLGRGERHRRGVPSQDAHRKAVVLGVRRERDEHDDHEQEDERADREPEGQLVLPRGPDASQRVGHRGLAPARFIDVRGIQCEDEQHERDRSGDVQPFRRLSDPRDRPEAAGREQWKPGFLLRVAEAGSELLDTFLEAEASAASDGVEHDDRGDGREAEQRGAAVAIELAEPVEGGRQRRAHVGAFRGSTGLRRGRSRPSRTPSRRSA